jgi:hypothetical protein
VDFRVFSAPNPFQDRTVLTFAIAGTEPVRISIHRITGEKLREILHHPPSPGWQEVQWDGRDQEGRLLPSGLYLYLVKAGERAVTGKLVFLR